MSSQNPYDWYTLHMSDINALWISRLLDYNYHNPSQSPEFHHLTYQKNFVL